MRDYFTGLGLVFGALFLFATLPIWLPVLVITSLITVAPYELGKLIRESRQSEPHSAAASAPAISSTDE